MANRSSAVPNLEKMFRSVVYYLKFCHYDREIL